MPDDTLSLAASSVRSDVVSDAVGGQPLPTARTALLVVDVQNDFADPSGALYVPGGGVVDHAEIATARAAGAKVVPRTGTPVTPHFAADGGPGRSTACGTWGAAFHPDLVVAGEVCRRARGRGRLLGVHRADPTGRHPTAWSRCCASGVTAWRRRPGHRLLRARQRPRRLRLGSTPWSCRGHPPVDSSRRRRPCPRAHGGAGPTSGDGRPRALHRPLRADDGGLVPSGAAATETVTFDLFVRSLPPRREFLVVAGIDTAVERLGAFTYDDEAVAYLATLGLFDDDFLGWLALVPLHRRGAGHAAQGELAFAGEPIVTVTAPLLDAQLLETLLINTVGLETMIASKAARVAPGVRRAALRRLLGPARPRPRGGAGRRPGVGHRRGRRARRWWRRAGATASPCRARWPTPSSWPTTTRSDAFRAYLRQYGPASILLVDTYDTAEGVRRAVAAMQAEGVVARAVRIDSGDLGRPRRRRPGPSSTTPGSTTVQVLASGDLDEDRIAALVAAGAPIDAFGVGTQLGTSADAPYLGMVYKLVEQAGQPRLKLSPGKHTLARPQAGVAVGGRRRDRAGGEAGPAGARPLLETVFDGGPTGAVGAARRRARSLHGGAGVVDRPGARGATERGARRADQRAAGRRASESLDALARGAVAAQAWVGSAGA